MKVTTRKFLVGAVLALAAVPAAEAQRGLTVDAGGGLYLQQIFGRAQIREPEGAASELSIPPGTTLRRLERLEGGWIAAGSVDSSLSTDLFLLRSEDGERKPFPLPPNVYEDPLRSDPVPLVDRGQLLGMAWLAGSEVEKTAVYAALWSGADWSQAELVAPVGPGTQIALDGSVLADGSWLLVWSAYDGTDDEILSSRRVDARWSEPVRIHAPNDHPDIVPSIVAAGQGALAAWSSSDGSTYRVRTARFEDGSWRELDLVGPAGSVHPSLTPSDGGPLLLYRTVAPGAWTLHQLDDRGASLKRAVLENETTFRPGLAPPDGALPAFEWPGAEIATPLRLEAEWQQEP